jgi:hypothetical protein
MTIMPWGKFRGVPLDKIESGYLCWCLDHADTATPALRSAIRAELAKRFAPAAAPPPPPPPPRSWMVCPDREIASNIVAAGLRALSKKHHPDVGGDTKTMQRINAAAAWLKGMC